MDLRAKLAVTFVTAFLVAACNGTADNRTPANANTANTKAVKADDVSKSGIPSKDELVAIEKKGWEYWATRNAKGLETYMGPKFLNVGSNGPSDRPAAMKSWTGHSCEMKEVSFSDENVSELGEGLALMTFKATATMTCGSAPGPSPLYVSVIYGKDGDTWKAMYYHEVPAIDAKGDYGPPSTPPDPANELPSLAAAPEAIASIEKKLWETWKAQDQKAFEEHISASFVTNGRTGRLSRGDYLKGSFGPDCRVESYSTGPMKSMELAKDTTLIIYRASSKGKCGGQALSENVMAVSIYRTENGRPMAIYFMENPLNQKS
ncbi:MAG TPA: nuclear transport factor 2 family protein [Pyrinomonadaceae bacterium]|nr:nuclear transport factor 2 family protein [Pyrinomonadaceae bacterium]